MHQVNYIHYNPLLNFEATFLGRQPSTRQRIVGAEEEAQEVGDIAETLLSSSPIDFKIRFKFIMFRECMGKKMAGNLMPFVLQTFSIHLVF